MRLSVYSLGDLLQISYRFLLCFSYRSNFNQYQQAHQAPLWYYALSSATTANILSELFKSKDHRSPSKPFL